jgi:hypothetical protein
MSTTANALNMKLVDDLRNVGCCKINTDKVLPTVAKIIRIGGPYVSDAVAHWYSHSEVNNGLSSVAIGSVTHCDVFTSAVMFGKKSE